MINNYNPYDYCGDHRDHYKKESPLDDCIYLGVAMGFIVTGAIGLIATGIVMIYAYFL